MYICTMKDFKNTFWATFLANFILLLLFFVLLWCFLRFYTFPVLDLDFGLSSLFEAIAGAIEDSYM